MASSFKVTKTGIEGNLIGNVQGTSSYAITASYALNCQGGGGGGGIGTETDPVYRADSASLKASASVATIASQSVYAISAKTGSYDALQGLPAVAAADNGKILMVVSGAWTLVTPVSIYTGSAAPDAAQGNDGDIYLQS